VHICTPPVTHADLTVRCLQAGAWVLVEKPPTLSLAEYDRIEAAEHDGGPYASVVFQHRFGSAGRHAAGLIGSGELGRPLVALCNTLWYRPQEYFDVPWRGRWATEGGGPTMGHGIHQMDLLLALLGDWTEVTAVAGRLDRVTETEDVSMAVVRFENGAMASVVNSVLSPREESYLRVDLTDATIEVSHLYGYENTDWTYTPASHVADQARIERWRTPQGQERSGHQPQVRALLDAMDRGERPPLSGSAGRQGLELVTGLYQSAFTGQPVRRSEITPASPFYRCLHGDTPGWAPGRSAPDLDSRR
jgi:predicted dehydrogenase